VKSVAVRAFLRRVVRFLLGDRPRMMLLIYAPTLLGVLLDLVVRPLALARLSAGFMALYLGSAIAGAGMWGALLWLLARLYLVEGGLARAARIFAGVSFTALFFPFAAFAYGGQLAYYKAFTCYMSRDSVRMGVRVRGTVLDWIATWGAGATTMIVGGVVATALVLYLVRRAAPPLAPSRPVIPVFLLGVSLYCYGTDFIETRALQAAPPDVCFMHGIVYAARMALFAKDAPPTGVTLRTPKPVPALSPPAHRPDVILVLSESLRADAMCSAKTAGCDAPFLDAAVPERLPLGKMTVQASGTFSSCMIYWTGMPVEVDFKTAHETPMIWEIARAAGYRTAYIGSQNLTFQDLGTYLRNAGIDLNLSAVDFGDAPDVFVGAPDERPAARTLEYLRDAPPGVPSFVVLHLSNTHWPYRVEPGLEPFTPHATGPLSNRDSFYNHYRNAVRLQERTVAEFLGALKKTPRWEDTAVLFTADHGEQFREHRRLYHLTNLFEEEVRVPAFAVFGGRALTDEQRDALQLYDERRTYGQDVNATLIDLLGVHDQRARLPFAELRTGRSLLRKPPPGDPIVTSSTTSCVYEDDDPVFGARQGEVLAVAAEVGGFRCFDTREDPTQHEPSSMYRCKALIPVAEKAFPFLKKKKK
jgi:glucan phosphoethanolaminetransferase (alkaline phosphatase superfamily)